MLTRVAGDRTELVQELALLTSAGMRVARPQSLRQIMPTGLLHRVIVAASGRKGFEANTTSPVGKILRKRASRRRSSLIERTFDWLGWRFAKSRPGAAYVLANYSLPKQ